MNTRFCHCAIIVVLVLLSDRLQASVTVFSSKTAWQSAAGSYATIRFTELPAFSWITDQYAPLGVLFTDGADQVDMDATLYEDSFGLRGAFDETTLQFLAPMTTLAIDFPGAAKITLLKNEEPIYTSPLLGGGGVGHFAGLVSTESFDSAFLWDPLSGLVIDNIYFGPPIPAPGALTLLALGFTLRGRRRRPA